MTERKLPHTPDSASKFNFGDVEIETWVDDTRSIARTADRQTEVIVAATVALSGVTGKDALHAGAEIVVNGERVGQLHQPEPRAWVRAKRKVLLEWDDPTRFPQHAYFRARGRSGWVALETDDERLLGYRLVRRVRHPRLDVVTLCLYATMQYGLRGCVLSG